LPLGRQVVCAARLETDEDVRDGLGPDGRFQDVALPPACIGVLDADDSADRDAAREKPASTRGHDTTARSHIAMERSPRHHEKVFFAKCAAHGFDDTVDLAVRGYGAHAEFGVRPVERL
jgi:hypothetical protein